MSDAFVCKKQVHVPVHHHDYCFNIIAMETCLHSNRSVSSRFLMNQPNFHLILLSSTWTVDKLMTLYEQYTTGHNVLISIATNVNVMISIATALSTFTSKIIHFPHGNNGIIKKKKQDIDCGLWTTYLISTKPFLYSRMSSIYRNKAACHHWQPIDFVAMVSVPCP